MNLASVNPSHATGGVKLVRAKDELRAALLAAAPRRPLDRPRADDGLPARGPPLAAARRPRRVRRRRHEPLRQPGPVRARARTSTATRATRSATLRVAAEAGVDIVYAPPVEEVYPDGFATHVEVEGLTEVLCGDPARRGPGHFRGVTTVVAKLFNTVQPDVAYFGQKDAQQAAVDPPHGARPRLPGADRGAADRARARRAGDELSQRLPRARGPRAAPPRSRGRCVPPRRRRAPARWQAGLAAARASWPPPGSSRSTWRRATPSSCTRSPS